MPGPAQGGGGVVYHARRRLRPPSELASLRGELLNRYEPPARAVYVYVGGCHAEASREVAQAFAESLGVGLDAPPSQDVGLFTVGCHGLCSVGPTALVSPPGVFYVNLAAKDVPRVAQQTLREDEIVMDLTLRDPSTGKPVPLRKDIPFFRLQTRRLMRNCGELDPQRIEDSLMRGAYSRLAEVLEGGGPDEVIQKVESWGLRGRGIETSPCAEKWASFRHSAGRLRRLVAYVRTWDTAAQADYVLLEGDPHLFLEGVALAALATGCQAAHVLVPPGRPHAAGTVKAAIAQAYAYGLLGEEILGTTFSLEVDVETHKVMRLPYGEDGLNGATGERRELFHNVETLANLPLILAHAREGLKTVGPEEVRDTVLVSLAGSLGYRGVAEVVSGTPVAKVIEGLGGGVREGEELQGISLGGPLGRMLTPRDLTHERAGAAIGPGAGDVTTFSTQECVVDLARRVAGFLVEESCGKCAPCRIGTTRLKEILDDFCRLEGDTTKLAATHDIAQALHYAGACEQGRRGAACLLSALQGFEKAFLAHSPGGSCSAQVCGTQAAA